VKFFKDDYSTFLSSPLTSSNKTAYLTSYTDVVLANQKNHKTFVHKICNEPMRTDNIVMYFPKNFYLIDSINKKLSAFQSSGLVEFWIKKFMDQRFFKYKQMKQGPRRLNINHLTGVFNILFIGNTISMTIFVLELVFSKFTRN
jgi:hypothetical protein